MESECDLIYLDKRGDDGDDLPDSWSYYRVTAIESFGNPEGTPGSSVQACRLTWPALEDIEPKTDSPGLVSLSVAYETVNKALSKQWIIGRDRSILIGIRVRTSP
jgi:hypothetical protein